LIKALTIPAFLFLFLTPAASRAQTFRVLHNFGSGNDGGGILSTLALDKNGNLYGASSAGGTNGDGAVFELTPTPIGRWKESVLHSFSFKTDGSSPNGSLAIDVSGTTAFGGSAQCGCGVVFKLAPSSDGKWKYTRLHAFVASDGYEPAAGLIIDGQGNLYGTTAVGGKYGGVVVFEITP
jgi:hypothetical protein